MTPSSQPFPPRLITITNSTYTLRSLHPTEISKWSIFCASCFATKKPTPPPPSHFSNHYHHDPTRDPNLILVLLFTKDDDDDDDDDGDADEIIVSTLRIFRRIISPRSLLAGGIGEVCTLPSFRRKGLNKVLMTEALKVMKREGMACSLLHAAEAFRPVYERFGYVSVRSRWSVVGVDRGRLLGGGGGDGTIVRMASATDWEFLRRVHEEISEKVYAGCIVRSKEYWEDYIGKEMEVYVLEKDDKICGWLSLRNRPNGRYQMRDFGVTTNSTISIVKCLLELLYVLLKENAAETTAEIHLPTLILEKLKQAGDDSGVFDWEGVYEEDDLGWMYNNLSGAKESDLVAISIDKPHLIWPADSF